MSKAVFLTFSLTGNTRFVAERIGNGLKNDCGFDVVYVDALQICKALHLGEVHNDKELPPVLSNLEEPETLNNLKNTIQSADVFGIGSISWGSNPAPGFVFLLEEILPSSLFHNMKYFCVYSSYGALLPQISSVFSNILKKKNERAKFLGYVDIVCPENGVGFLPFKPEYDGMSNKQVRKLDLFVKKVTDLVAADQNSKPKSFPSVPSPVWVSRVFMRESARKTGGHPLLNKKKCIKCGTCVRSCPYNVIVMKKGKKSQKEKEMEKQKEKKLGTKEGKEKRTCNEIDDIEDGFPVWMDAYEMDWEKGKGKEKEKEKEGDSSSRESSSQCWGCGRCFNLCPKEAIEWSSPDNNFKDRTRYRGPAFVGNASASENMPASVSLPQDVVVYENPGPAFFMTRLYGLNTKKTKRMYSCLFAIVIILLLTVVFIKWS